MAIKVSGTTVVDDSRNLTNIASVDATTVTAIGAAGVGGGGTHDFVASGAIANGDIVGLNADGTVSVVEQTSLSLGSKVSPDSNTEYLDAVYDSYNNKVVLAYQDENNSDYGTAIVGTVSGTTITFGTPVAFTSSAVYSVATVFDSNSNKVVISYRDSGNSFYEVAIVGTVSGTSISFGSPVVYESSVVNYVVGVFDSTNNKVVFAYENSTNTGGKAIVGTVSGTSISFGTAVTFYSGGGIKIYKMSFDPVNNKVVIAFQDEANGSIGKAILGTVSGTSISFGSTSTFSSAHTANIHSTHDPSSGKIVIAYWDYGGTSGTNMIVGTISGTSISFGTAVNHFSQGLFKWADFSYDEANQQLYFVYSLDTINNGYIVDVNVSGTTTTIGTPLQFESNSAFYARSVYDSYNSVILINYMTGTKTAYSYVVSLPESNASSYIGVAAEAISDTATGEITIIGGVNEGQTGLTTNQSYFVADDGTLTTTNNGRKIGEALSASELQVKTKLTGSEMNEYLGGLV